MLLQSTCINPSLLSSKNDSKVLDWVPESYWSISLPEVDNPYYLEESFLKFQSSQKASNTFLTHLFHG